MTLRVHDPATAWQPLDASWTELVEPLGDTVWLGELSSPGLRARVERRGASITDDPSMADTVLCHAGELDALLPRLVGCRVACLCRNRRSPLAAGASLVGPGSLRGLRRRLESSIGPTRAFTILRSVDDPLALLPTESPEARRVVGNGLRAHYQGLRRVLLMLLLRRPAIDPLLAAGHLVIADHRPPTSAAPTGQIGYPESHGFIRVLGEPPVYFEREGEPGALEREATILAELSSSGAAHLTPEPAPADRPGVLRTTALPGSALLPRSLSPTELLEWTERAARTLRFLHDATRHADGTVIVHGDFWLGNLRVDGNDIVGVVDWELAHRGEPAADVAFLVDGMIDYCGLDDAMVERLESVVSAVFDERNTIVAVCDDNRSTSA